MSIPIVAVAGGHLGNAISRHGTDSPEAAVARRDLAAARIAEAIRRNVSQAPPLTTEQRRILAGMLER